MEREGGDGSGGGSGANGGGSGPGVGDLYRVWPGEGGGRGGEEPGVGGSGAGGWWSGGLGRGERVDPWGFRGWGQYILHVTLYPGLSWRTLTLKDFPYWDFLLYLTIFL